MTQGGRHPRAPPASEGARGSQLLPASDVSPAADDPQRLGNNGHMPTSAEILLSLIVVVVAFVAVILARKPPADHERRRATGGTASDPRCGRGGRGVACTRSHRGDRHGDGPSERGLPLRAGCRPRRVGPSLATAPRQLDRYTTGLRVGADAAHSFAELSGRLVLVDDKTAAALRSGRIMKDKAGEILGKVLREDGKIPSVTRLREIGGSAATAASLTNALSAMAMHAQLDRIER